MANIFDIDSGSDNHLMNEQFHAFSKSPSSALSTLGTASNKSGHTTTASDVWAEEIPAFFYALDEDAFNSYKALAAENDICRYGDAIYLLENGEWTQKWANYVAIPDGQVFKNSKGSDVIRFHNSRVARNLTLKNNASDDGDSSSAKIDGWNEETGKVWDYVETSPHFVTQFVAPTDKIVSGIPSKGFGPIVIVGGSPLTEGADAAEGYIANNFAGIIQFNKKRTQGTVTVHAFEYIGDKVSDVAATTASDISGIKTDIAAINEQLGLGNTGEGDGSSVGERLTSVESSLKTLTGTEDGVAAESIATTAANAVTNATLAESEKIADTEDTGKLVTAAAVKTYVEENAKVTLNQGTGITVTPDNEIGTEFTIAVDDTVATAAALKDATDRIDAIEETGATALSSSQTWTAEGEAETKPSITVTLGGTNAEPTVASVSATDIASATALSALTQRVTDLHATPQFSVVVLDTPAENWQATAAKNTIYLVKETEEASAIAGSYIEYIAYEVDGSVVVEKIGSTTVDLSDYVTTSALNDKIAEMVGTESVEDQIGTAIEGLAVAAETKNGITVSQTAGKVAFEVSADTTPTKDSTNLITSGAVEAALTGVGTTTSGLDTRLTEAEGKITELETFKNGADAAYAVKGTEEIASGAAKAAADAQTAADSKLASISAAEGSLISVSEVTGEAGAKTQTISLSDTVAVKSDITSAIQALDKDTHGANGVTLTQVDGIPTLSVTPGTVDTASENFVTGAAVATAIATTQGNVEQTLKDAKAYTDEVIEGLDTNVSDETGSVSLVQTNGAVTSIAISGGEVAEDETKFVTGAAVYEVTSAIKSTADAAVQTVTGDNYVEASKSGTAITLTTKLDAIDTALVAEGTAVATAIAAAAAIGTAAQSEVDALETVVAGVKTTADTAIQTAAGDTYVSLERTAGTNEVKATTNITAIDSYLVGAGTSVATAIASAAGIGTDAQSSADKKLASIGNDGDARVIIGTPTADGDEKSVTISLAENVATVDSSADTTDGTVYTKAQTNKAITDAVGTAVQSVALAEGNTQTAVSIVTSDSNDVTIAVADNIATVDKVTVVDGSITVDTEGSVYSKATIDKMVAEAKPESYIATVADGADNVTSGEVAKLTIKDDREQVYTDDLWGTSVTLTDDNTIVVSHSYINNPNADEYSAWITNVTKVEDNKAYNANNIIANVQTDRIKNGYAMFYRTQLASFDGDLNSLTNGVWMFGYTQLTTFNSELNNLIDGEGMFAGGKFTTFDYALPKLINGENMFLACTNLRSFTGDLSGLTDGSTMFKSCSNLTSFNGDLSSLTSGYQMFGSCSNLTSFNGDLTSLTDGAHMFSGCKLDTESVECIADTINTVTGSKSIYIGIGNSTPDDDEDKAFAQIKAKGWNVYVNGSAYTPTVQASITTLDEHGEVIETPIPFYAKPIEVTEEEAEYVGQDGKFYQVAGGQFIYVNDPETYGMFTCLDDAVANMRLTPYVKPIEEV